MQKRNHHVMRLIRSLTVNDKLHFFVRVAGGVSWSIDGTKVDPVVPPHHLCDGQVRLCAHDTKEKMSAWKRDL